jgi:hypothetical protein
VSKYKSKIATNPAVEMIHAALEKEDAALQWAKKESFPWPTVIGKDLKKAGLEKYATAFVPGYILIDKNGKKLAEGSPGAFAKIEELTSTEG